jgi:hypothetical protein
VSGTTAVDGGVVPLSSRPPASTPGPTALTPPPQGTNAFKTGPSCQSNSVPSCPYLQLKLAHQKSPQRPQKSLLVLTTRHPHRFHRKHGIQGMARQELALQQQTGNMAFKEWRVAAAIRFHTSPCSSPRQSWRLCHPWRKTAPLQGSMGHWPSRGWTGLLSERAYPPSPHRAALKSVLVGLPPGRLKLRVCHRKLRPIRPCLALQRPACQSKCIRAPTRKMVPSAAPSRCRCKARAGAAACFRH